MRRAMWLAIAVVAVVSLGVGVTADGTPETAAERVQRIASTVKCPECIGQPVSESNSGRAQAIRLDIARQVDAGATDDQIVQSLVDRYGEGITLVPEATGFAGLVWALPVLALVLSSAGLGAAFLRWRRQPVLHASDADRALVERARSEQ
jgi:cytochrome c-type biogenesis protein CcmH